MYNSIRKAQNSMVAMSSDDDQSPHHRRRHPRRSPYNELLLSAAHKTLTKTKSHATLLFAILSSVAICFYYISHLQNKLARATHDLLYHQTFDAECSVPVPSSRVRQTIIDKVFYGTSPWEDFPPAYIIPLLRRDVIIGWGSENTVFERLIREVRPKTIVEIGTFLGASALHMSHLTEELELNTQILCIDDFRGWAAPMDKLDNVPSLKTVNGDTMLLYQFMQNVVDDNTTASIMFLPFASKTALARLCQLGVYGDLVEVDADHDFHMTWMDINNGYNILRPGGVMFGHDYNRDTVWYAVHIFARLHGLRVERDGEHWILR